jgi:hypothetical protein
MTTASLQRLAHDSGDGATVLHCPFCGGGQVVGRSDGTIECEFDGTAFTVQVQPLYSGFPQTVNGAPFPIPGMPGQIGGPPMAPGPMDAMPPGAEDDGGNPFADAGQDTGDPADAGGDAPPWADDADGADSPPPDNEGDDSAPPPPKGKSKKKSARQFRTASGARLSETAFAEYLAVRHSGWAERAELLERLRQSRTTSA